MHEGKLFLYNIVQVFKNKSAEIAKKLLPAFNTPTGIPMAMVNLKTLVHLISIKKMLFVNYIYLAYFELH